MRPTSTTAAEISPHAHIYATFSVPPAAPTLPDELLSRYELHYTATFTPMFLPRFELIQNFHMRVVGVICDHFHFDRLFPKLDRSRRVELCEALLFEARAKKWERETPRRFQQLTLEGEIRELEIQQHASGHARSASDSPAPSMRYSVDSLASSMSSPARTSAASRYSMVGLVGDMRFRVDTDVHTDVRDAPGAKTAATRDDILPWEKFEPQGPTSQPVGTTRPPSLAHRPTLDTLRRVGATGLMRQMDMGELQRERREETARKSAGDEYKPPPPVQTRDRTTY